MSEDVDFDHFAQSFTADPAGSLRELRETCPVAHSRNHGGFWVLTRRADIATAGVERRSTARGSTR